MSVEVKLQLGHHALLRDKPTTEGFTHDWTVFVRGPEGSNIQHFVDKVVFHLHESFPKPKRVVKEPPYQVSESGYAGFIMPIEVYFRNKEEPKKVKFEYDLYLRMENSPVNNIRLEKLTFQNPSDDFRRKLLKAGGVGATASSGTGSSASLQTQACAPAQHVEENPTPPVLAKASAVVAEKKQPRSHLANKEIAKPTPPAPKTKEPDAPLKVKTSPNSPRSKDSGHSNQPRSKISPVSTSNSSTTNKEVKPVTKEPQPADTKETKSSKPPKLEKEVKSVKRLLPTETQGAYGGAEKKKRHISVSSENSDKLSEPSKTKVKDGKEKNEKPKSRISSGSVKKEKEKSKGKSNNTTPVIEIRDKPKTGSQVTKPVSPVPSALDSDSNDSKRNCNKAQYSSPASSISETSLDANRPLSSMMSEIENDGLSPLTSDPELSPYPPKEKQSSDYDMDVDSPEPKVVPKDKIKDKVDKKPYVPKTPPKSKPPVKSSSGNGNSTGNDSHTNDSPENDIKLIQKETVLDRGELMELQQKIMSSNDRQVLQKVVDVIEKTGKFQVSNSSFDFDLCALDHVTVKKLKLCLTS